MLAKVYRQDTPSPLRGQFGTGDMYSANLVHIGDVSGSHSECWKQAKAMCNLPLLEFSEVRYANHS